MDKPKIISTETAHENPWYRIRHDKLVWPNGKPGEYFVAEYRQVCIMIAEQDGQVLLIQQYRHPVEQMSLGFPGGYIEKDEDPEAAARREFREETGYEAQNMRRLGVLNVLMSSTDMLMHVFAAQGLTSVEQRLDDGEHGLTSSWLPVEEWGEKIRHNEIKNSESLSAWALYQEWKSGQV